MATPHDDGLGGDVLPPVTDEVLRRVGQVLIAVAILAVVLSASAAPVPLRAPLVLVTATLLPGFPLVARLRVDLPTLLALSVCTSLAMDAGFALLMVEARFWHPQGLGLALAAFGVGATMTLLSSLTRPPLPTVPEAL